jgi:hypothetical protein
VTARLLAGLLMAMPLVLANEDFPGFHDVAGELGLDIPNLSGEGSNDYIVEANGNGAGFIDFDRDGDLDLLIASGSTVARYRAGGDPMVRLWENRDGEFVDVTQEAGLTARGWGMGVCVADYDNDGWSDFYVTAYGPNRLFRNVGGERFEETSAPAGVDDPRWGTNCAFGDYDRDGDVDLYVANYLEFDERVIPRRGESDACRYMGMDVFCGPLSLGGEPDALYRNEGDGTFVDVTVDAGVEEPGHYGFGVVFSDFDDDGWPDIYVANDSVPNLLFRNDRDGTFSESGLISGTALSLAGYAQAGMGIGVGDYDGNGLFDIFVTNFAQDTNTLYQNLGDMLFLDVTAVTGVARASRAYLGWGAGLVDLDNDGWEDVFVANGHVYPEIGSLDAGSEYLQRKEVYRNLGDGRFEEVAPDLGGDLGVGSSARGAAFGDYDNDGDIDVLVVNMNAPPSLYRNEGGNTSHWIGFRLEGVTSNRDAIGARIEIDAGGRTRVGEVRSGGSYLSQNDLRVHFGLGELESVEEIRVRWPNGNTEAYPATATDRYLTLREGEGFLPR